MAEYRSGKNNFDEYCWKCHKTEPGLFCTECERAFHISPACSKSKAMTAEAQSLWRCPECINFERDRVESQMDQPYLNRVLGLVADGLLADEYLCSKLLNIDFSDVDETVFHPLDLAKIKDKTTKQQYRCIAEFSADIKWIEHNVKAHLSRRDKDAVDKTKWLVDYTNEEMASIRMCSECYCEANQRPDNWMVRPCQKPHLLVWAKQKGYPYWPAKLCTVDDTVVGRPMVDIYFFSENNKRSRLSATNCRIYSEENPGNVDSHQDALKLAIYQADEYRKNLIFKFGSFHFGPKNGRLDVRNLERHLYEMIPGAWKQLGHEYAPKPISKERRQTIASVKGLSSSVGNVHSRRKSIAANTRRLSQTISMDNKKLSMNEATTSFDHSSLRIAKPKKQKIYDNLSISSHKTVNPPAPITSTNVVRPFEVPAGQKARKTFPNTPHFIPTVKIPIVPSARVEVKQETKLFEKRGDSYLKSEVKSDVDSDVVIKEIPSQTMTVDSSSMFAIQNAVIEQSTLQMTECIRSSLQSTLMNFRDIPLLSNKMLQEEIDQLRIKNDLLTLENRNMKSILDQHNECIEHEADLMTQIEGLNAIIDQFKAENERLKRDLERSDLKRKKQWCATCDMPGSRYYCSKPCEDLAMSLNKK
ncbi:uncharacterized protein LOC116347779 [Contarinia nasturtii]|uniref:uncharacterized protein LOC116347779 n=1 Tax=Contarinia nasturtii TaxID=265458 RepID=UPI0012D3B4B1|nr:uncharacterized protein LOC116347779 [Contarinia nasturtii]